MKPSNDSTENSPGLARNMLAKGIETLLNQALKLDEDAGEGFTDCDEKVIQLTFTDFKQTLFIIYYVETPEDHPERTPRGQFIVQSHLLGSPDAHVQMTVAELLQGAHQYETFGDTALAASFINAFKTLEVDWEEQLSKLTGDLVAFKVGSGVRRGQKAFSAAQLKLAETFKEYLQFEVELLPTHAQVKRFNTAVTETEDAVDSLANRIEALATTPADTTTADAPSKPPTH